jgi:hypothetical protein
MRFVLVAALAAFGMMACGDVECDVNGETVGYADCEALETALGEVDTQEERADLLVCHADQCE